MADPAGLHLDPYRSGARLRHGALNDFERSIRARDLRYTHRRSSRQVANTLPRILTGILPKGTPPAHPALVLGAGEFIVWLVVAVCLVAPLYLLIPENPVPTHLVALFALLAMPLTRAVALPAAVAWNRHR
jgi:hypothetical protein